MLQGCSKRDWRLLRPSDRQRDRTSTENRLHHRRLAGSAHVVKHPARTGVEALPMLGRCPRAGLPRGDRSGKMGRNTYNRPAQQPEVDKRRVMVDPLRVHQYPLRDGIRPTPEFAKKKLAQFSVNVGIKCGHGCTYCSSGALLRCHVGFKHAGESPFKHGYCIVDPDISEKVGFARSHAERRASFRQLVPVGCLLAKRRREEAGGAVLASRNLLRKCRSRNQAGPGSGSRSVPGPG